MKVLLMIHSLAAGGAERVLTLIADGLAARGHEVYLLTLAGSEEDFFCPGGKVRRVCLKLAEESNSTLSGLWANLQRIRAIRNQMKVITPSVILSFTTSVNVLALLATMGSGIPVVVSERVDPREHLVHHRWRILRAWLYRRAHVLVVQTNSVAEWFRHRLPARVQIEVIENPSVPNDRVEEKGMSVPRPFMLAAGRLVHQKGFDLLIEAFGIAAPLCPGMSVAIAGTGPESEALESLATQRRLSDRVFFLGRVKSLGALMRQADAFVLSSRYEGFPNVLLEALASGVPVVAADCPSGPREILEDGKYGILVPSNNPPALAEAIIQLAADVRLRERLSAAGMRRASCFHPSVVIAKWERILLSGDGRR